LAPPWRRESDSSRRISGTATFRTRRAIPPWRRNGSRNFFETERTKGHTIRVWRNGPERQKKHRVVRDAAPVRHKLHAGQGPGLFRTLSDRCNEHCLRSASLLRRRSLWVNHRRMATAKPYEQHSRAGAEVFSVGSSDPRLAWVAGSFAFRP